MQKGDFVRVKYSIKVKENGIQLSKPSERPFVVGYGWLEPPLEEALTKMSLGDKKEIEMQPRKLFGERNAGKVKTVSLNEFKKHGVNPKPGMFINADEKIGKVLAVSGGRVKLDLNHPDAGKMLTLVYDIEIVKKIEEKVDKIKSMVEAFIAQPDDSHKSTLEKIGILIKNDSVEISLPAETSMQMLMGLDIIKRKRISTDIMKLFNMKEVKFVEIYEKPSEEAMKKAEELDKSLDLKEVE